MHWRGGVELFQTDRGNERLCLLKLLLCGGSVWEGGGSMFVCVCVCVCLSLLSLSLSLSLSVSLSLSLSHTHTHTHTLSLSLSLSLSHTLSVCRSVCRCGGGVSVCVCVYVCVCVRASLGLHEWVGRSVLQHHADWHPDSPVERLTVSAVRKSNTLRECANRTQPSRPCEMRSKTHDSRHDRIKSNTPSLRLVF